MWQNTPLPYSNLGSSLKTEFLLKGPCVKATQFLLLPCPGMELTFSMPSVSFSPSHFYLHAEFFYPFLFMWSNVFSPIIISSILFTDTCLSPPLMTVGMPFSLIQNLAFIPQSTIFMEVIILISYGSFSVWYFGHPHLNHLFKEANSWIPYHIYESKLSKVE